MFGPLTIKHHSLSGRISSDLLVQSFWSVARNKGAAGVDGMDIDCFRGQALPLLSSLRKDLKSGLYLPCPVKRVYLPKADGSKRPIGIPTVRDRVAQEALRRLLEPLFEPLFHCDSYGFRPGRSAHQAMRRVLELHRSGYRHVLDADILGFFDHLPQPVLMRGLTNVIADGNILALIERILKAGVSEDGVVRPTTVGTPQGGVLSPLLANIALNFLDWHLGDQGYRFVRYADDFVVLCRATHHAQEARIQIESYLKDELGLTLSNEKTKVTTFREGFTFLGFELGSNRCRMRKKSVENLKNKIREGTIRKRNLDARAIEQLNAVVRGTVNYFGADFSRCRDQFRTLDRWYRMRLRCMKYKRKSTKDNWRLRNTRLRRMGVVFFGDEWERLRSKTRDPPEEGTRVPRGEAPGGRPVPETGTPVNRGN
jgi:RNA-directed DNA polymerase